MRSCAIWLLTLMLVMMDSSTCLLFPNSTRWEVLEATANRVQMDDEILIRVVEGYRYESWVFYERGSRLYRPVIVNEMSESLKEIALWETRLDMIGLILFGPERSREILRTTDDKLPQPRDSRDIWACYESVGRLLSDLCGPTTYKSLRHSRSLTNMCMLVETSEIREAVVITCGLEDMKSYVPQQQVPYGLVAFGSGLQYNASVSEDILNLDADDNMRVLAVKAIILSCVYSSLCMVAAASCLALCYVISSMMINTRQPEFPEFPWEKFKDGLD